MRRSISITFVTLALITLLAFILAPASLYASTGTVLAAGAAILVVLFAASYAVNRFYRFD